MRLLTVIFHSKIFSKCDSFGEFLSYMEHVMMETPELLNKFEESETETWSGSEKIQNLWEWESFFYTFNIKSRTIYDRWHHGKSVEGVKRGFQCIKKSHKQI